MVCFFYLILFVKTINFSLQHFIKQQVTLILTPSLALLFDYF